MRQVSLHSQIDNVSLLRQRSLLVRLWYLPRVYRRHYALARSWCDENQAHDMAYKMAMLLLRKSPKKQRARAQKPMSMLDFLVYLWCDGYFGRLVLALLGVAITITLWLVCWLFVGVPG